MGWFKRLMCLHGAWRRVGIGFRYGDDRWVCIKCGKSIDRRYDSPPMNYIEGSR